MSDVRATADANWGDYSGACGFNGHCHAWFTMAIDNIRFLRNSSNCETGWIRGDGHMTVEVIRLGWLQTPGQARVGLNAESNIDDSGILDSTYDKGPRCAGDRSWAAHKTLDVKIDRNSSYVKYYGVWGFSPGSHWTQWPVNSTYTLPYRLRITGPSGLSASSSSTRVNASLSSWSGNSAIGGRPTSYGNAKDWNWRYELLSSGGYTIDTVYHNTYSDSTSDSCRFSEFSGGSEKNTRLSVRVTANNNANLSQSTTASGIVTGPPTAHINIDGVIYNPTNKTASMKFTWSKPSDGGAYTEKAYLRVANGKGEDVVDKQFLIDIHNGASYTNDITLDGLDTGEKYTVYIYIETPAGTTIASATAYAPVANAAFIGFEWDDVRRTCTIKAEAPGAANCRIEAGYVANGYDVGNKLTVGQIGTLVVKDLKHGEGQILYLQATPEASDGYKYMNEVAKISIPIPNPILGVYRDECGKDSKQKYIVDMVEKKKDCNVSSKWQVGDRTVTKEKCGG